MRLLGYPIDKQRIDDDHVVDQDDNDSSWEACLYCSFVVVLIRCPCCVMSACSPVPCR